MPSVSDSTPDQVQVYTERILVPPMSFRDLGGINVLFRVDIQSICYKYILKKKKKAEHMLSIYQI